MLIRMQILTNVCISDILIAYYMPNN